MQVSELKVPAITAVLLLKKHFFVSLPLMPLNDFAVDIKYILNLTCEEKAMKTYNKSHINANFSSHKYDQLTE